MHRIAVVLKVETYNIARIVASRIGRAVILVIIYVKTFTSDVIVFIGNVMLCMTSY